MARLCASLLGPTSAEVDGEPVRRFRANRVQALLLYLVTEQAFGSLRYRREALMDLLWPGMPQSSAQQNLRQTLYELRKVIPKAPENDGANSISYLQSARHSVQFNSSYPLESDIAAFRNLLRVERILNNWVQTVALFWDDFLCGFYPTDAEMFEAWVAGKRGALQ